MEWPSAPRRYNLLVERDGCLSPWETRADQWFARWAATASVSGYVATMDEPTPWGAIRWELLGGLAMASVERPTIKSVVVVSSAVRRPRFRVVRGALDGVAQIPHIRVLPILEDDTHDSALFQWRALCALQGITRVAHYYPSIGSTAKWYAAAHETMWRTVRNVRLPDLVTLEQRAIQLEQLWSMVLRVAHAQDRADDAMAHRPLSSDPVPASLGKPIGDGHDDLYEAAMEARDTLVSLNKLAYDIRRLPSSDQEGDRDG